MKRIRGFTLIELLIVIAIIEILTIPLIGFFVFPLRAQANLSELTRVNRTAGLLESHLSDDVRCANSISIVKADGDRDDLSSVDVLLIERGAEEIVYRSYPAGQVEREVRGEVPITHTFDRVEAVFSAQDSGRYESVRVDMILDYKLLRGPFKRQRTSLFLSRLENRP